jgi:hypothetical protein
MIPNHHWWLLSLLLVAEVLRRLQQLISLIQFLQLPSANPLAIPELFSAYFLLTTSLSVLS